MLWQIVLQRPVSTGAQVPEQKASSRRVSGHDVVTVGSQGRQLPRISEPDPTKKCLTIVMSLTKWFGVPCRHAPHYPVLASDWVATALHQQIKHLVVVRLLGGKAKSWLLLTPLQKVVHFLWV